MFYHLRGVSALRTSMDFIYYYIYEDTRVLGSISNSWGCVFVEGVFSISVESYFELLEIIAALK